MHGLEIIRVNSSSELLELSLVLDWLLELVVNKSVELDDDDGSACVLLLELLLDGSACVDSLLLELLLLDEELLGLLDEELLWLLDEELRLLELEVDRSVELELEL